MPIVAHDLWRRDGGVPDALPTRWEDASGLPWTNLVNSAVGREACLFVKAAPYPDHDPSIQYCAWAVESASWLLLPKPPIEPPVPVLTVTHKRFLDLLTFDEQAQLKFEQKVLAEMTSTQFAASPLYKAFAVALEQFEKSSMIELANAQTIAAIKHVMLPLNIFASMARCDRILANLLPE